MGVVLNKEVFGTHPRPTTNLDRAITPRTITSRQSDHPRTFTPWTI